MSAHPFERAGLGKAPFRLAGYTQRVYRACPGAPVQPGGSCDYCGQGIRHCYQVRASSGERFEVGCDCAGRVGETELVREMRRLRRAEERRQAAADAERRRAEQRARNWVTGLGNRTDAEIRNQREINRRAEKEMAREREAAVRQASVHVGAVGKRSDFVATFERLVTWDSAYGLTRLYILRDRDGNTLVWKTSSGALCDDSWEHAEEGDAVRLRGTVKDHDLYDGCRQTVLTRVKVSEIIRAD